MSGLATNPKYSGAVFSRQIIPTELPFGEAPVFETAEGAACRGFNAGSTTVAFAVYGVVIYAHAPTLPVREQSIFNRQFACYRSVTPQIPVMAALIEMEEYRRLEDGWDGYGSVKPPLAAIQDARDFYLALPFGVVSPEATVSADGTVGWYWKAPSKYVSVQFSGNRRYVYYGDVDGTEARGFYDLAGGRVLPDDLMRLLMLI